MADLVMGAMSSIIPKLGELLKEEYHLQTSVKDRISYLTQELEHAQAALCKVAEVPWDQLDKQVQLWARKVREASYDMEDVLDTFLVRVKDPESAEEKQSLRKHLKEMASFLKKSKARRKISGDVKDIMTHLQEVTEQCRRYKVDDIVARPATTSTVDPRLAAMYTHVKNLVGMDKSSGELMSKLQLDDVLNTKIKIVSIVGVGGLGKTTLARAVYEKIKGDFSCSAFVPVGQNPDLKKIFKDILIDLDKQRYLQYSTAELDERQLIDELRGFLLENKRFLIVIDDIWKVECWETIKLAFDDDSECGGRIIITTRKLEVATKADEVYKLQPLPYDSSRELFIRRISGHEGKDSHNQPDKILDKFVRKCSGIPLAIITMASLLAGKRREEWPGLYNTIDFGSKDNKEAENTMRILSLSYYDLPSHLRTCLLYLSAFPEDSVIDKDSLVWKWIAEGFVHKRGRMRLFEIGEGYFNDLINRSLIQAEEHIYEGTITIGCRVHDIVLDFIRVMSREEFFFTVLDNDQDTLLQQRNIVRRIAYHNRTIGHPHQANHIEMPKLRSFIGIRCVIETWAPPSSLTLIRVLAIEYCKPQKGRPVQVEGLSYLPHLRFLSLRGTRIDRIPEEIGALRFLQTLDLLESEFSELPSTGSLPKQLVCLSITLDEREYWFYGNMFSVKGMPSLEERITLDESRHASDGKVFSVEGMTSLEELTIHVPSWCAVGWLVDGLGCLRELRVLSIFHFSWDEEAIRDLVESLGHLNKLQRVQISAPPASLPWQETDLVLRHHLRHLAVHRIEFSKVPSCINPSCVPNLAHLDLNLRQLDEEDLKNLGRLPELHYLSLHLGFLCRPATIHGISDSEACYFPKLRSFKLRNSMFWFVVNEDDKRVSFHIWNGRGNMPVPSVSDDELKSDDEMQRKQSPMPSVSRDDLHRPLGSSKLQRGLAAVAYYLLAFFLHVLAFVKRWHPLPSNRASSPGNEKGQDPDTMPSVSEDESNYSTICNKGAAAAPRFMPSLQVLHFEVNYPLLDIPNWVCKLSWEHLSSLQEINVQVYWQIRLKNKLETELRRAAEVHPNHPELNINSAVLDFIHLCVPSRKGATLHDSLSSDSYCGDWIHHP